MSVIAQKASGAYGAPVSLRPLFAMLIAFAMLFAPFSLQGGAAMALAMAPADHHAQMMESGHCREQPAKGNHEKAPDKSCCVAMCAAVAVAPTVTVRPHAMRASVTGRALAQFHHSFLAELPTPPPRLAQSQTDNSIFAETEE